MTRRRKAREIALQTLYAVELSGEDSEKALEDNAARRKSEGEPVHYARELIASVNREKERLDSIIESNLKNWKLERLALVDLIILRIAIAELIYFKSIPKNVIINEAIEIAHKFSSGKAGKFVNGILDKVSAEVRK
ncbi:MAG: transcription antitermination factor NusB [Candidatus Krumholzibacteriales bacterium]